MNAPLPPHPDDTQPQYALIEAAMAWLADMRTEQPSLEDLAEHIGYAPAHLQKVFTRWVGVSPKRFLSYLTLDYAKERLAEADSVLDAAMADFAERERRFGLTSAQVAPAAGGGA